MKYTLLAKDKNSDARCGVLTTDHGNIETPIFMPVGTVGTVKAVQKEPRDYKVTVEFDLAGQKIMYASFAKLKRV